jgi:hypothetical protein
LAQIFSWIPYSQTPSAYIPPSMSATKFHTHAKQIIILYILILFGTATCYGLDDPGIESRWGQ